HQTVLRKSPTASLHRRPQHIAINLAGLRLRIAKFALVARCISESIVDPQLGVGRQRDGDAGGGTFLGGSAAAVPKNNEKRQSPFGTNDHFRKLPQDAIQRTVEPAAAAAPKRPTRPMITPREELFQSFRCAVVD